MSETTENPVATVRALDSADPEVQSQLLPVLRASIAGDLNGHPGPGAGLLRAIIAPRGDGRGALFATFDADGAPVNFGKLGHSLVNSPTIAYGVMHTVPSRRGRGHGSALLARMKEWAVAEGCDRLVLDGPVNPGGAAFAARHGFRVASGDWRSTLDLRRIDADRYRKWARPSADNAGYRTVSWITRTPEELLPSFARAIVALDDAPHEGVELGERSTEVEPQRAREAAWEAAALRVHTLAAVAPDGEVAGYTQVFVYDDTMHLASIGDTAVLAPHRGHGLGLRMKAEMSLRILELEPQIDQITTWNDATNRYMLRVNTDLGYEVAETWNRYLFEV